MRNKQGISFNIDDNCWNLDLRLNMKFTYIIKIWKWKDQKIIFINFIIKTLGGLKTKI